MLNNNLSKNNLSSNKKKFINYKFLLDKTYNKINKLIEIDNLNKNINIEQKQYLKYLMTKLEKLLLITNDYKLILDLETKRKQLNINKINHNGQDGQAYSLNQMNILNLLN